MATEQKAKDVESHWAREKEKLVASHGEAIHDLKERLDSQRKNMDELLEKNQME